MKPIFSLYGRRFLIFSALLFTATIALSYYIDPFSVYGRTYIINGKTVNSPGFTDQVKMGKALAIAQRKPEILILGSSRTSMGLSSHIASQFFPEQNIYNGAFPGINIYELLRYFQHTVASAPLKTAYIGLDFYQFHGGRPPEKSFREERLAVDINNQPAGSASADLLTTLFSVDAVFYSMKVALGLYKTTSDIYFPNGFIANAAAGGWLENFIHNEGSAYINKIYTVPAFTFNTVGDVLSSFDYFRKLVRLAHAQNIKLHFFISPSHARQWEVIHQLGLWNKWEYWKQEMLRITQQEAQHYGQTAYPIYDFSGYSQYSTESVPRTPDTRMHWYADSSHYRQALGTIIFTQMLKEQSNSAFGRILNTKTIDAHLRAIRADKLHYQASHAQDIADIRKLIELRKKVVHTKTLNKPKPLILHLRAQ